MQAITLFHDRLEANVLFTMKSTVTKTHIHVVCASVRIT